MQLTIFFRAALVSFGFACGPAQVGAPMRAPAGSPSLSKDTIRPIDYLPKDPAKRVTTLEGAKKALELAATACEGAITQAIDPLANEIALATFRHLFSHNASAQKARAPAYYLTITREFEVEGRVMEAWCDPPMSLLARLAEERPPVRPVSARPAYNPRDISLFFFVGHVALRSTNEAIVEAGYYEGSVSSARSRLFLRQGTQGWTVEKEEPIYFSLLERSDSDVTAGKRPIEDASPAC